MTQRAYDAVDRARNEFLRKQRKCAWCGAEFKTSDGLVAHITLKHPSGREDRDLIEWAKGYKENPYKDSHLQGVYFGTTQSGKHGLFTGNYLAWDLSNPKAMEKFKADPEGYCANLGFKYFYSRESFYKNYQKNPCHGMKKNPAYGYGAFDYDDNPPRFDDLSRALNTINTHYNLGGKHVTVAVDGPSECYVQITDNVTDDIIKAYGPFSRDGAILVVTGMLEVVRNLRYE